MFAARNARNQSQGKSLEIMFSFQAQRQGLLAVANGQKVRWLPGGKTVAEKCQLDFTLLSPSGQAAFVDCKTVAGKTMAYSAFDPRQLALARTFQSFECVAGFLVYFRAPGQVGFYSASDVDAAGPGKSVSPKEPYALGALQSFDLRRLFTWPST